MNSLKLLTMAAFSAGLLGGPALGQVGGAGDVVDPTTRYELDITNPSELTVSSGLALSTRLVVAPAGSGSSGAPTGGGRSLVR